jgi:hypothetical protein
MVFGVGIGGIGGPQRLYAPDNFNPADNIMILLYAFFGVFAFLYVGLIALLVTRPIIGSRERALPATALLAYAFGYGLVLSIIEDQAEALFIGAALGVLCRETAWSLPLRFRASTPSMRSANANVSPLPSPSVPRIAG